MGKKIVYNEEMLEKIKRMTRKGFSLVKMSERIGVSETALKSAYKENRYNIRDIIKQIKYEETIKEQTQGTQCFMCKDYYYSEEDRQAIKTFNRCTQCMDELPSQNKTETTLVTNKKNVAKKKRQNNYRKSVYMERRYFNLEKVQEEGKGLFTDDEFFFGKGL